MVNTLNPPLEVIQSWPEPNYDNPETRGEGLFIISIVLASLGILMVTARLYSRFFITKAPGFDDALIVFALLFAIALSVLVCIGNKLWFSGHHVWDIPPDKFVGHRLDVWIAQWNYVSALSCVKISVLLFYRRLSVTFSRTFMIATWIGIIYNALYWAGFCLTLLLICQPVNAYWHKVDPEWANTHDWRCGSEQIALPVSGALSVVGDFYSALLPMLLIMGLDLPRRQKKSLYALFAIAFLVVAAGVARTVLVNTVINKDYDFTWVLWEMWIWGQVELYVALLAASAPALKPFLRRFLVEPMNANASSRKRGPGYGDQYGDRIEMQKGLPDKRDLDDPERIGVAYGGYETKSREESLVKELDDVELETRHFELRQSRDGRKMVPTQIWKKRRNSPSNKETDTWPVPPTRSTHQQHQQHQDQRQGHVRNFSQPHSNKSSGDTTKQLLQQVGRSHIVSQISPFGTDRQPPDPHDLGQTHVLRHLSQGSGSVKQGRLRAQKQQPKMSSKEPSPARVPRPSNSLNTSYSEISPPPQYQTQGQYFPHQQPISDKRDAVRQAPYAAQAKAGRGSRLDFPSEDSGSDDSYSDRRFQQQQEEEYEPPWMHVRGEMQNQMYVVEKPSWQYTSTLKTASSADHNRSSSEETLALPRMGSIDDFNKERVDAERIENMRRKEAELNAARARIAMREMEREMEREAGVRRQREIDEREGSRDRGMWKS